MFRFVVGSAVICGAMAQKLSFKQNDDDGVKQSEAEMAPKAGLTLQEMMKKLRLAEQEKAEAAKAADEERKDGDDSKEGDLLSSTIRPTPSRGVCIFGEEALVPPEFVTCPAEEKGPGVGGKKAEVAGAPAVRRATATARTTCTIVIMDTLGWAARGGMKDSLAAPPPLGMTKLQGFLFRYATCEKGRMSVEEFTGQPCKKEVKRNGWAAAWDDDDGVEVAAAVMTRLRHGLPCCDSTAALLSLQSLLGDLLPPFR